MFQWISEVVGRCFRWKVGFKNPGMKGREKTQKQICSWFSFVCFLKNQRTRGVVIRKVTN